MPMTNKYLAEGKARIAALDTALDRVPWLLPLFSFGWGWASFLLMRRGEEFARVLALLAFVGWPWLLAEPFLRKFLQNRTPGKLTEQVLHFIGQSVQQELLFFSLPLILGATQPHLGQIHFRRDRRAGRIGQHDQTRFTTGALPADQSSDSPSTRIAAGWQPWWCCLWQCICRWSAHCPTR